jgi:hypothetical protein
MHHRPKSSQRVPNSSIHGVTGKGSPKVCLEPNSWFARPTSQSEASAARGSCLALALIWYGRCPVCLARYFGFSIPTPSHSPRHFYLTLASIGAERNYHTTICSMNLGLNPFRPEVVHTIHFFVCNPPTLEGPYPPEVLATRSWLG